MVAHGCRISEGDRVGDAGGEAHLGLAEGTGVVFVQPVHQPGGNQICLVLNNCFIYSLEISSILFVFNL